MAEVPVNINGVIVDLYGRTIMGPVKIVGSMSRTDVGIGGGPIFPPPDGGNGGGDGKPPGIWGGGNEPFPTPPIYFPPQLPPSVKPPEPPAPGSPTTTVPGNWPVAPVVPPAYVEFNWPGIGPVIVAPPVKEEPEPI